MIFAGGDDELLRKLFFWRMLLLIVVAILLVLSGIVQFLPKNKHDFSCTVVFHPLITLRYIQLNEPILPLPRDCHG